MCNLLVSINSRAVLALWGSFMLRGLSLPICLCVCERVYTCGSCLGEIWRNSGPFEGQMGKEKVFMGVESSVVGKYCGEHSCWGRCGCGQEGTWLLSRGEFLECLLCQSPPHLIMWCPNIIAKRAEKTNHMRLRWSEGLFNILLTTSWGENRVKLKGTELVR
jgi:hypothetical protein